MGGIPPWGAYHSVPPGPGPRRPHDPLLLGLGFPRGCIFQARRLPPVSAPPPMRKSEAGAPRAPQPRPGLGPPAAPLLLPGGGFALARRGDIVFTASAGPRRPCGGPWRPGLAFVPRPEVPSGRLSGCGERGWGLRINPAPSGEREKPRGQGVKQRQRGRSAEGKAERRWREDSEAWPGHSAEQSRAEPGRAGDSGRLRGPAGLQPRSPLRHRAGGYLPYTARWERP